MLLRVLPLSGCLVMLQGRHRGTVASSLGRLKLLFEVLMRVSGGPPRVALRCLGLLLLLLVVGLNVFQLRLGIGAEGVLSRASTSC